jgi:phage repressor protein C with HTH and peptisase S24 domain
MAGEIGRVIKRLREQSRKRQSDLSKDCNVKQPNLSRIEKGHCEPRHATLARIAEALGTSVEVIEAEAAKLAAMTTWPLPRPGSADERGGAGVKTMTVPVFDTSAGYGVDFDAAGRPVGLGDLVLQVPLVDVPCFACRVSGDSMSPRAGEGFAAGDILVFAQRAPRSGDFAFARTRAAATFRQVFFEAGEVRLVPLNRSYEELRVASREIVQMWKLVQHLRLFE